MHHHTYSIAPLGDSAIIVDFGNVIEASINRKVFAFSQAIKEALIDGIYDIVPAYSSVTVHYDPVAIVTRNANKPAYKVIKEQLKNLLLEGFEELNEKARRLRIPVCYSEKYGWDLEEMSIATKLPVEEIIAIHTAKIYRVFMVGFLPGFAYMGEVDERIAVPRKAEPRQKIEEGYVGIAGKQTGIYPLASPGGWQIIGRTYLKLFDKDKEEPSLFAPGDEVQFFSISEDEFDNH
jgi:inhibitor of KinA